MYIDSIYRQKLKEKQSDDKQTQIPIISDLIYKAIEFTKQTVCIDRYLQIISCYINAFYLKLLIVQHQNKFVSNIGMFYSQARQNISEQQAKRCSKQTQWSEEYVTIHSHKQEAEFINIMIWRKNTTMPIFRVKEYEQIQQKNNENQYPKTYKVTHEKMKVKLDEIINWKLSETLYVIIQALLGYQAIAYKFGEVHIDSEFCGFNNLGEFRVSLPGFICTKNKNIKISESHKIIQSIFQLLSKLVPRNIKYQLDAYLYELRSLLPNLSISSANLLIRQRSYSQNNLIPHNLANKLNYQQIPYNNNTKNIQSNISSQNIGEKRKIINSILYEQNKKSVVIHENSSLKSNSVTRQHSHGSTINRDIRKSSMISLGSYQKPRVNWNYNNHHPQQMRSMNSSNIHSSVDRQKRVSLAYSMCINPVNRPSLQSQSNIRSQVKIVKPHPPFLNNIPIRNLKDNNKFTNKQVIIKQRKGFHATQCFGSYLETVADSQHSQQILHSKIFEQKQFTDQKTPIFINNVIKQIPTEESKISESNFYQVQNTHNQQHQQYQQIFKKREIVNQSHLFSLKSRDNCVSRVYDQEEEEEEEREGEDEREGEEGEEGEGEPKRKINQNYSFGGLLDIYHNKQANNNNNNSFLNQSFSNCDSPLRIPSSAAFSQSQIVSSEKIPISNSPNPFLGKQSSIVYQQNGWKKIQLFEREASNLKQSLHCGNQSNAPIMNNGLNLMKLKKLGSMGRQIGKSCIPESQQN